MSTLSQNTATWENKLCNVHYHKSVTVSFTHRVYIVQFVCCCSQVCIYKSVSPYHVTIVMENAESAKIFLEIVTIALIGGGGSVTSPSFYPRQRASRRRYTARGGEGHVAGILPAAESVTPPSSCPWRGTSRRHHPARGCECHVTVILPAVGQI